MAIAATRNAMVYKDKLTFNLTVFFIIVSVILGVLVNTMGIIGFLPIIAMIQITLCNYYLKSIKTIKMGFIVNSAIYVVYFLAIFDISSAAIESITASIGLISLFRLLMADSKN